MLVRIMSIICLQVALLLTLPVLDSYALEQRVIDMKADKVLRQMSTFMDTLKEFSVHTENSVDRLLTNGQTLQLATSVDVFVQRPDRVRANIEGDIRSQEFYYNGKTITLYGKKVNFYGTLDAPSTIESALDYARANVGLVAPLADVIYRNSYEELIANVNSGFYAGLHSVNGVECHHLAFVNDNVDWQIWIENSETPVPRKFVITEKWITSGPQFTALITDWNLAPKLGDRLFTFSAPEGARKIEFLKTEMPAVERQ